MDGWMGRGERGRRPDGQATARTPCVDAPHGINAMCRRPSESPFRVQAFRASTRNRFRVSGLARFRAATRKHEIQTLDWFRVSVHARKRSAF